MFQLKESDLKKRGAEITTREIKQQPSLWQETWRNFEKRAEESKAFLERLEKKHAALRIIFTGAGTSAYVGDMILPHLKGENEMKERIFEAIPTTNLVSNPAQYFQADFPTLLVSFARSGNSPESIAAVELGKKCVQDFYQITITCAKDGKLARSAEEDENHLLLLMPEKANDQGFAMTGSFTCMALTALLLFDTFSSKNHAKWVREIVEMGEQVIQKESFLQELVDLDFERIVYLGSGSLAGLAREAQLKILELTAGKIATLFDSSMGFRHGPKSFVNQDTLVIDFVSNDAYTKQYDVDIISELREDEVAKGVCAISASKLQDAHRTDFDFGGLGNDLPDAYLALPFVMIAQTLALLTAVRVSNLPDTPSPSGTVNRVVKGVTIHSFN
ncbi:SIS domain-containing protein [Listeria valentina]|uniref:SIS domain-containing protein n=1 Tax=Listeria valentina TaxID=2705293 RepID=UPI001431F32B|nr:SIS domain-containing protein [Listeria valentina]